MIRIAAGAFLILHGLVHLLYFGQTQRIFELRPGMAWPDQSWVLARFMAAGTIRLVAGIALLAAALGLIAGGAAVLFGQRWWQSVTAVPLVLSSVLYLVMWNARFEHVDDQGAIGILINVAILVAVLILRWPRFAF
jgi:sterol desaturase/sphingolipid hydroxylase (fatty acid hydroxylase superfamily)